jgi:hypothetical protein
MMYESECYIINDTGEQGADIYINDCIRMSVCIHIYDIHVLIYVYIFISMYMYTVLPFCSHTYVSIHTYIDIYVYIYL